MTIHRKSVKIIASKEEVLRYRPKKNINVSWTPIKNGSSVYIVTLSCSSFDGVYQNDIDEELANLNVFSDRIREPKELNKIPKNAMVVEANINDSKFKTKKDFEDILSIVEKNFKHTVHENDILGHKMARIDEG